MVKDIGYLPERVSPGLRNNCFSGTITAQQPCTEVIVTQPLSAIDWGDDHEDNHNRSNRLYWEEFL